MNVWAKGAAAVSQLTHSLPQSSLSSNLFPMLCLPSFIFNPSIEPWRPHPKKGSARKAKERVKSERMKGGREEGRFRS